MDLTGASDSDGELEAKHQGRYSPGRLDKSPPRWRSPGCRHNSHLDEVPKLSGLHLGAYTPSPPHPLGSGAPFLCHPRTQPFSFRPRTPSTCVSH